MKCGPLFSTTFFLLYLAVPSHARLILQSTVSTRNSVDFVRSVNPSEFQKYIDSYGSTEVRKNGRVDKPGLTAVASRTEYRWSFESTVFYSYIKAFRTDLAPPSRCQETNQDSGTMNDDECEAAVSMFRQCHLFLLSTSRKLIAVQPMHIPQPVFIEGKPGCFDVYAMAPAKVVKNGMLIVAGYHDSRWICNSGWYCASDSPVASPDPLYKTTFLVRFSKDAGGNLILRQDDECLPPLNNYDTIASARRALIEKKCS